MLYFVCEKCGARYTGWGVGKTCSSSKCGGKLKEISESEMDNLIKEKNS